jgi:hypothetical protein
MDVRKLREGILIRLAEEVQAFKSFSGYQFTVEQLVLFPTLIHEPPAELRGVLPPVDC